MIKPSNTWIVVADGARGRFFKASDDMKTLVSVGKADMVSPKAANSHVNSRATNPVAAIARHVTARAMRSSLHMTTRS